MRVSALDAEIAKLQSHQRKLSNKAAAVFSAACTERLSEFYDFFCRSEHWGNYNAIRGLLDLSWEILLGHSAPVAQIQAALNHLPNYTPDSDDFGTALGLIAQDVCICLDITARWCIEEDRPEAGVIAYTFEGLIALATERKTGFLDVGDQAEQQIVLNQLIHEPLIGAELERQRVDLSRLSQVDAVPVDLVEVVREEARAFRHHPHEWLSS